MTSDRAKQLRHLLANAREIIPENEFCGIGVVLYSDYYALPVFPLCPDQPHKHHDRLVDELVSASLLSNPCHDGFHLISLDFELTHRNQYFAPPLPDSKEVLKQPITSRGARYVSAQLGSLLPCVCFTGVVSERDGLIIFENGREV